MGLKVRNSLTRRLEDFVPINEGTVKMYVCGPTVYDDPHIGHLRSAYVFDVMRRHLAALGLKVRFVRNVTDIDDKIIDRARRSGMVHLTEESSRISRQYWMLYDQDLARLGIQRPDQEPRATRTIPAMLKIIEALIQKGFAYTENGDVYFSVSRSADYGKLSGQKRDAMLEGTRLDANEKKKEPLDFALWKAAKENEPAWDSPWGKGRPGWHIECSAMNYECLGEQIDIHGGGRDLIFPHHENEIAQSEAFTGLKPFAKYWLHHGLVTVNGQKMSKSAGNFTTLSQLVGDRPARVEELKFLFLGTHYSADLDYSEDRMQAQKTIRDKFINLLFKSEVFEEDDLKHEWVAASRNELQNYLLSFIEAMNSDFNTPLALTVMHELAGHLQGRWSQSRALIVEGKKMLKGFFDALGLSYADATNEALSHVPDEVMELIRAREEAKRSLDFKRADEIRRVILEKYKLQLIDEKNGPTTWKRVL